MTGSVCLKCVHVFITNLLIFVNLALAFHNVPYEYFCGFCVKFIHRNEEFYIIMCNLHTLKNL